MTLQDTTHNHCSSSYFSKSSNRYYSSNCSYNINSNSIICNNSYGSKVSSSKCISKHITITHNYNNYNNYNNNINSNNNYTTRRSLKINHFCLHLLYNVNNKFYSPHKCINSNRQQFTNRFSSNSASNRNCKNNSVSYF